MQPALLRQPVNVTGIEVEVFEHSLLATCQLNVQNFRCPAFRDGGEHQGQGLIWLS
ncbi:hypothetical protein ACVWY5_006455 [Bradyrhizobium sp. USDA 3256]